MFDESRIQSAKMGLCQGKIETKKVFLSEY